MRKPEDVKVGEKSLIEILEEHDLWTLNRGGSRAILNNVDLSCIDLSNFNLEFAYLREADLRFTNLVGANLSYADLESARLSGANMRDTDLRYGKLFKADMRGTFLSDANLQDAHIKFANLKGCILKNADMEGADLIYTVFSDADLSGANLRSADLAHAVFIGSDLTGADLRDVDLTKTTLNNARLRDVDLNGSKINTKGLNGADLSGVNLGSNNLSDIYWIPKIANIHSTLYSVALAASKIDMNYWHKGAEASDAHDLARWIVLMAPSGYVLEGIMGTSTAAALIYMASDPSLERVPDFYAANEDTLANLKMLADMEQDALELKAKEACEALKSAQDILRK